MGNSKEETLEHIHNVNVLIRQITQRIENRALDHDKSKLLPPEKEIFDRFTPMDPTVTYGSEDYKNILKQMYIAMEHHYKNNRHHPEYHPNGIKDMDLIDLIELICDWKAATLRHDDGDIRRSMSINQKRFSISPDIMRLINNTLDNLDW